MSERNWGLIAAAGLGVVTFSAMGGFILASQTHSEHQQAVASDSGARDKGGRPQQADTDHAGVPALAERIISNPEPRDGTEREKRDLAAQENTAAWAFWIVVLAAVQAALSAVGIMFIVRTLRQSEAALAHARDVSETQLRPYVFFGEATLSLPLTPASVINMPIKNHGLTPAINMQVGIGSELVDCPIGEQGRDIEFDLWDASPPLGPNDATVFKAGFEGISEEDLEDVLDGRSAFVVRIVIRYEGRNGLADEIDVVMYVDKVSAIDGDVMNLNEWARHHSHEKHANHELPLEGGKDGPAA